MLGTSGLHLSVAGKGLHGIGAEFLHPFAQNILLNVQVTGGLRCRHPRSLTSLTASILNSRLNLRLRITTSGSMKHLNLVSIKPAAAQLEQRVPALQSMEHQGRLVSDVRGDVR